MVCCMRFLLESCIWIGTELNGATVPVQDWSPLALVCCFESSESLNEEHATTLHLYQRKRYHLLLKGWKLESHTWTNDLILFTMLVILGLFFLLLS